MAALTFKRNEVEKHIKLSPENIDRIMMLGIPIEVSEEEVTIEITPNRPDLLSLPGFLRAVRFGFGKEKSPKRYIIHKPERDYKVIVDKSVKDIRPFTACAIAKKIKFDEEKIKAVIDMQEKLHATIGRNRKKAAIGIYPLEKIKLPITFCAKRPEEIRFRPLESELEMNGMQILQRHPTGREYASLLEGKEKFPIFMDADKKILSMPPIINSHDTGKVSEETDSVFIECSGSDLGNLKKILNIIVSALLELGAEVYQMEVCYEKKEITPNLESEKIKINLNNINKLLGLKINESELEKLLLKFGYGYKNQTVLIPPWRTDILHEVDIAEDIAIAYGYDKLSPEIPKVSTIGKESKESKIQSKIASILSGLGMLEVSSYHLVKRDETDNQKELLEVRDSKTDYKILRPNLMIPLLRIIASNSDKEYPQNIFEIGRVFNRLEEEDRLAIATVPANFTQLKQSLDYLMSMLGIEYSIEEVKKDSMIEGRTGEISSNGQKIGYIGEIHPETLLKWGIKMPVAFLEISLDKACKIIYPK